VLLGFPTTRALATAGHASDGLSTNDNKVGGKKGKFKFPCNSCNINHCTSYFPHIEEASQLLEDNVVFQQQSLVSSKNYSPTQPIVDEVVNMI